MTTIIRVAAVLALLIFGKSVATPIIAPGSSPAVQAKDAVLMTKEEQQRHIQNMQGMTREEKMAYRNEEYRKLRERAKKIGYLMPENPPWAVEDRIQQRRSDDKEYDEHQQQLEKYRQESAERRKAMEARIAKQRKNIQQRIDRLVEKNGVQPSAEAPARMVPPPPPPMAPPYPRGYMPPPGPGYPGFYRVPY